jgi:hypothetical protein
VYNELLSRSSSSGPVHFIHNGLQESDPNSHQKVLDLDLWQTTYFMHGGGGLHIMYGTVPYSCLMISNRGSGPSRANKFLYASAPPPPSVWALKPPTWAFVHKTIYAPMIYAAWGIMFWLGLEFPSFLGPKWHLSIGLMPFHRAQKTLEFQGPTSSKLPS